MRKLLPIAAALILLGTTGAFAQSEEAKASNGSIYSSIGMGIPIDLRSSAAGGMGLTGVSFSESYVPGMANPAQWGSTVYGMASGGLTLRNLKATDFQSSATTTAFTADYFQLQLPVVRGKVGVSASVAPLTDHSYTFIETKSRLIQNGGVVDTLNYQSSNIGNGGVNMLELGFGWKINSNISVGYAGSLVFASLDNSFNTFFDDPRLDPVIFLRQASGLGFGNRLGVQLNVENVLRENDRVHAGVSVMFPVSLDMEKVEETDRQLPSGAIKTLVLNQGNGLGEGDINLPMTLNGGITYQPGSVFSVTAEGLYQEWSQFSTSYSVSDPQKLTDRYKMGMGFRYFPYIKGSDKFFSKFKYRLGASYDAGHLKLNGRRVETLMVSLGLGIISPRSNSSVDINFEYGVRGTQAQNLVKERIWGIKLSLNLAELMFYRPKLQ